MRVFLSERNSCYIRSGNLFFNIKDGSFSQNPDFPLFHVFPKRNFYKGKKLYPYEYCKDDKTGVLIYTDGKKLICWFGDLIFTIRDTSDRPIKHLYYWCNHVICIYPDESYDILNVSETIKNKLKQFSNQ